MYNIITIIVEEGGAGKKKKTKEKTVGGQNFKVKNKSNKKTSYKKN